MACYVYYLMGLSTGTITEKVLCYGEREVIIQNFNRYMLAVPIQCLAFMCYVLFKAVRCS